MAQKKTSGKKAVKKTAKKKSAAKTTSEKITNDPYAIARGDRPMTVVQHLDELRSRLLSSLLFVIIITCIGLYFSDYLLSFVTQPYMDISGKTLKLMAMQSTVIVRIKISIILALNLSIPFFLFQVWRFIRPAINKTNRTFTRIVLLIAIPLFYLGVAFIFFILFPFSIEMLIKLQPENTELLTTFESYLSFLFVFSITMGFIFELPIIMLVLSKIGIITPQLLISKRKYAIVAIWIIAAIVTPADILTQIAVAVPLMFLYEVSIVISRIMYNKRKKKQMGSGD